jgi:3-methylfumaryl-CoA hydratase
MAGGGAVGRARLDLPHAPGDPLPLPFHFMLFRETTRRSATAPDGHARRGDFLPPIPLLRRMYAGGRMVGHAPLVIGEPVEEVQRIAAIDEKSGSSGQMFVVRVEHEYRQRGRLCLAEERDLIYLGEGGPVAALGPTQPVPDAAWQRDWDIDPGPVVPLFRAHLQQPPHPLRPALCAGRGGLSGPRRHGPLLATLLCRLAEEKAGRIIRSFRFRAMRPFFLGAPVRLRGGPEGEGGGRIDALTPSGEVGMQGLFEFA